MECGGFRPEYDRNFSHVIRSLLFDSSIIRQFTIRSDQLFLDTYLWSNAQNNSMTHDSYRCASRSWNIHHRPFPTQRPMINGSNYCFIGCVRPCCIRSNLTVPSCQSVCRPKEHQDWIFC